MKQKQQKGNQSMKSLWQHTTRKRYSLAYFFFSIFEFLHSFHFGSYWVYIHLAQESSEDDGEEEEQESEKSKSEVHDDHEEENLLNQ